MDYVNALRFVETETNVDAVYDAASENIVFITGMSVPAFVAEDLPF